MASSSPITGPSGCGKSTLLNLLGGLDRPSAGEIYLHGERVDGAGESRRARLRRSEVGFVFQFFNLIANLTVADNVELPALLAGVPAKEARRRAAELLDRLGLSASGRAGARERCRAASSSASRSPARSSTARASCSPTSRPATSTAPPRATSSASCASARTRARRSCW